MQLRTETVAAVGNSLIDAAARASEQNNTADLDTINLSQIMHSHGLNMRYLGLLYRYLTQHHLYSKALRNTYSAIQVEALQRVLKNRLRAQWRLTDGSESKLMRVTADVLNKFFGKDVAVDAWQHKNS